MTGGLRHPHRTPYAFGEGAAVLLSKSRILDSLSEAADVRRHWEGGRTVRVHSDWEIWLSNLGLALSCFVWFNCPLDGLAVEEESPLRLSRRLGRMIQNQDRRL